MHRRFLPTALAGLALALAANAAQGYTCYMVLDAKDAVVYRDMTTPVDLSARGTEARDALRKRGSLLMIFDTDQCAPIGSPNASGSSRTSLTDITDGIRPAVSDAAPAAKIGSRGSAPLPTAASPAAPARAPAAPRRGTASGGY
jgi:hypothetical protein